MVNSIATTIGTADMDWDKRVDAVSDSNKLKTGNFSKFKIKCLIGNIFDFQFKRIRSLLIAGAANFDDFLELIKKWEMPFVESLKDLRFVT